MGLCISTSFSPKALLLLKQVVLKKHFAAPAQRSRLACGLCLFRRPLDDIPQGGETKRLTNHIGLEASPDVFTDGKLIAFTGEYDGNVDVL